MSGACMKLVLGCTCTRTHQWLFRVYFECKVLGNLFQEMLVMAPDKNQVIEYSVLGSMPSVLPFENLVMVHILVLKVFFQIS